MEKQGVTVTESIGKIRKTLVKVSRKGSSKEFFFTVLDFNGICLNQCLSNTIVSSSFFIKLLHFHSIVILDSCLIIMEAMGNIMENCSK